ncbi:uncharacterized protein LOC133526231 [Cydia pomonella]|uniref:uncharacterized protein LOC133526231 n=1 Tax=Cydia pomonella TaxID=82600 RepID=UPI002ADD4B57|nr:uncharacterized protein LOC133526231 [Cydia pomonella]
MWKNMVLYFYVAAVLVAGEWQPQDYVQSQSLYPVTPPTRPLDQRPVSSSLFTEQLANMPRARPCRRRNFGEPVVFTDSGWVPVPFAQPPMAQQIGNQLLQPQLKPQSLTENSSPTVDDKKHESDQMDRKSEHPDKIVEFIEKKSVLNQMSASENKKATPDQKPNNNFLDSAKDEYDPRPAMIDSHEDSLECGRKDEADAEPRYGNSETQDLASKSSPNEAHDQAVKLLANCIHESRRSMPDYEMDSRKLEADSPSSVELDKTGADITSKTEPLRNTQTNVLKPILTPNTVVTPSKNAIDMNKVKYYLKNPAKNAGKWNDDRQVSLMENGKACYACSTYHDPSCWKTNATTTIKYCNRDNNACLTKMYKIEGKSILIRDCGHTCNEDEGYNIGQKMVSCSMCHNDMCNSAYAIHSLNVLLVGFVIVTVTFTLQ